MIICWSILFRNKSSIIWMLSKKNYVQVFIEVFGWFVQLGQPLEANFGSLFLEDAFVISRPPGQGGLSSWGVASQFAAAAAVCCSRTWGRCGWPHVNHVGGDCVVRQRAVAGMIPPTDAVLVGLLQLTCQLFCKKRGNVDCVPLPDLNWAGNQTDKHGGLAHQKSFWPPVLWHRPHRRGGLPFWRTSDRQTGKRQILSMIIT